MGPIENAVIAGIITAITLNVSPKLIYFDDGSGKIYEGIHTRVGTTPQDKTWMEYDCSGVTEIDDCSASEDSCNNVQDTATAALLMPFCFIILTWASINVINALKMSGPTSEMVQRYWSKIVTPTFLLAEWALVAVPISMLTHVTNDTECNQNMGPALIFVWVLWAFQTIITVPAAYMAFTETLPANAASDYSDSLQKLIGA